MKIRNFAAIAVLVLSSLGANSVAPSKTELEAMYDKAFREFDANNYEQALKDLDGIDARQPDLAESQNLRGVIMMRQKDYEKAEVALRKALKADPKFWNARFNLAEVPFLQKNWPEARKRFQELLSGNASELQGEATQLIQYKIMITYLMEGKENMVTAMISKFELAPETPAVHYANAALSLNKKDEPEAKKWLTTAEKNFSPQLNKLFAESLYTIGWLEKPAGQTRAAIELNSAAERAAQTQALAQTKFEEAEQALQQRDFTAAKRLVDEADTANPNQPAILNLRGEVLLEQKDFDGAEREFQRALRADPKLRDAQYNLAQVPFKKKDYAKARERFEQLFATTSGADKDRAAQLVKFKVYLTYLLEGKDARAQKMMEQFQFTGDTPALYYAQAAWEFKHDNAPKANDWVNSARKIYPPALNGVFADAFFDLGWLQIPTAEAATAPAIAETTTDAPPSIEPTPLPAVTLAQNNAKATDPLTQAAQANSVIPGMEATTLNAEASPGASTALASSSPSVETPNAATASPAAATPVLAATPVPAESTAAATPATVLAPATMTAPTPPARDWSLLSVVLGLAGILLLAYGVYIFRRRSVQAPADRGTSPATGSSYESVEGIGAVEELVTPTRLAGGPPQVSLQLRASEPALRRAVMPSGKGGRGHTNGNGNGNGNGHSYGEGNGHTYGERAFAGAAVAAPAAAAVAAAELTPTMESFDEGVGEPVTAYAEQATIESPSFTAAPDYAEPPRMSEFAAPEVTAYAPEPTFSPEPTFAPEPTFVSEPAFAAEPTFAPEPEFVPEPEFTAAPMEWEPSNEEVVSDVVADEPSEFAAWAPEAPVMFGAPEPVEAIADEEPAFTAPEAIAASAAPIVEDSEPIGQGQPVPYLTSEPMAEVTAEPETPRAPIAPFASATVAGVGLAGIGALRHSVAPLSATEVVSQEPTAQQPTTPVNMPQPTQPTPAPVIRTGPQGPAAPSGGVAPQAAAPMQQPAAAPQGAGGMHTAVQLTFSFEIASMQLTPTFKMGTMQLKPTSRIVTMRLAPAQHPQPAMNLQVTFEIATVQLNGNALGMIRLTPSQQQRPSVISSPSFNIQGLQLVAGSDAAPVQMTPAQQGQASVHVTAPFQIATVEFSPSFEIASIILNATSRNVSVQLPGAGPSAIEGAPVFEIGGVQLAGNGEIGMMQLNPQGAGAAAAGAPKRA